MRIEIDDLSNGFFKDAREAWTAWVHAEAFLSRALASGRVRMCDEWQKRSVPAFLRTLCLVMFGAAVAAAQSGNGGVQATHATFGGTPPQRCDAVMKLDFENLPVHTARRKFAFRNGVAVNFDLPPERSDRESPPDWKARIEKDTVVQPAPDVVVRFLLIHDSHVTGSGWRYYLTGLRCSSGKLQEVFHRDGLSLGIERLDSTSIIISLNGTPGDAVRKRWSYTWDRSASKYVLSSTQSSLK